MNKNLTIAYLLTMPKKENMTYSHTYQNIFIKLKESYEKNVILTSKSQTN